MEISQAKSYASFLIKDLEIFEDTGKVFLKYGFENGPDFVEEIDFGISFSGLTQPRRDALDKVLHLLRIAAGISYYKAFVPDDISYPAITSRQAGFFSDFYFQGLGEFAARNNLNLAALKRSVRFEGSKENTNPTNLGLKDRALVLVGGGKDSLVSIEALKSSGKEMTLFAVNPSKPIRACIEKSGLNAITVKRTLDPKLFELNEQGALNGHVPITGIISLIALASAIIHDYDAVVLSNERSANEETTFYQDVAVNHQFSKSFDFEKNLSDLITGEISTDLKYFSFLRPLSELSIAKAFSKCDRYDDIFTSCNATHRIKNPQEQNWCGMCPKCRFTFLMLAPFMQQDRLVSIFGQNILDSIDHFEAYKEICGLTGQKPWECVGEREEAAAAFYNLSKKPEWQDCQVVAQMTPLLKNQYTNLDKAWQDFLTPASEHNIPADYLEKLNGYISK